jgi:DNA-binding Lrp family transcriptional regulator
MVAKQIRKTSEEIKEKILTQLKKGPMSTKKLSDELNSNWSTINNYLEELGRDGKVREIYSKENLRIYIRSDYPVFYGLPLDKDKLKQSLFLLSRIVERWNAQRSENIAKIPLQKIAVDIITKNKLDIPVVRFHYGKVLATYFEPQAFKDIITIYDISDVNISDKIIDAEIDKHTNVAWKEKRNQYESPLHPEMKIFDLSDKVSYLISKSKFEDAKQLTQMFNEILLKFPTEEKYSQIFEYYHEFLGGVNFIFNSTEFYDSSEEDKRRFLKEILETFDSLWQTLTTEFFFDDIEKYIDKNFIEIFKFIKENKTKTHYCDLQDKLNNLLDYKKSLTLKNIELNDDERKIVNILLEGANEE